MKHFAELEIEIMELREMAANVGREYTKLAETMEYIYFLTEEDDNTMTCDTCQAVNKLASKHIKL